MTKGKYVSKLSLSFIIHIIISLVACCLLFSFLFMFRYQVFHFIMDDTTLIPSTKESIAELQQEITDEHVSKNDRSKIKTIFQEYRYLTMQLYDDNGTYYMDHLSPLEEDVYLETSSLLLSLYYPRYEFFQLQFYDGVYNLTVYSYHGVWFMEIYLIFIIVFCILLFVIIVSHFVQKKVRVVLALREELKLIEMGDFHHVITYQGKDELTELAMQLNQLRMVLESNLKSEQEAKEANHDLVTAMSHDLRTPLTSLLGYLNILNMKIYKNEEELAKYILKSKITAEQIKEMSDRLFTYFLVYSQDEEIKLDVYDENYVNGMLENFASDIIDLNLEVSFDVCQDGYQIEASESFMKRILDNLLSNLSKYAKHYVRIKTHVTKEKFIIYIENDIKEDISNVESSKIGLKSMKKMISYMHAEVIVKENKNIFTVEIQFPLKNQKSVPLS